MLLAVLRGLIFVKRHLGPLSRAIIRPLAAPGRFLVRTVGIPLFRAFFYLKRQFSRLVLPAKHRLLYLVSNRYAIHVAVIGVAAVTSSLSLGGSEVRAEDFGQHSMLYALVSENEAEVVEVVEAADIEEPKIVSYMEDPVVDAMAHIDVADIGDDYVTTTVGGSALAAPAIQDSAASVAPRTEVESYVVQEGDTLGGISEQYGLSLSSLLWANQLTFRSTIRPGLELKIPPVDGVVYTVKKGDTISKIAQNYSADADQIIAFNNLASADDLVVGEDLMVPGGEPPAPPAPVRTAPLSTIWTGPTPTKTTGGGDETTKGSSTGAGTWIWPTDWRVITQYYGWKHTGIDVDGDYTTQSYAAADGVVIYSGWRNGYGNTVEVDHGNGLVTRYAHHSKNYVSVGDVVTTGQALAQTGTTGRSTGTHLHFEVIKNGKFQNPLDYVR